MNDPAISMYGADQKHTATNSASASTKASTIPQIKRRNDAEAASESWAESVVTTISPRGGTDFAPLSSVRAAARQDMSADIQSQIEEVFQCTIGDVTSPSRQHRARDDGGRDVDPDMAGDGVRQFFEQGGFGSGRVVECSVQSQGASRQETKTWVAAPCECQGVCVCVCVSMCRLNVKVWCECVL